MKQYIGTYKLGTEHVKLVLSNDINGGLISFKTTGLLEITVGMHEEWWQMVSTLMHEAIEFAFWRHGLRFVQTPDYGNDNGNYLFVASHTDYSEALARAALFITGSLPALNKGWKLWLKNNKKLKKKKK